MNLITLSREALNGGKKEKGSFGEEPHPQIYAPDYDD